MRRPASLILTWLPAVLWAGVIYALSAQPDLATGLEQDFILRKVVHVAVFGVLAWLIFIAVRRSDGLTLPALHHGHHFFRHLMWTLALVILYAFVDEYHQTFVPGREGSPVDVGIDLIGALLVMGAFAWHDRRRILREIHEHAKT